MVPTIVASVVEHGRDSAEPARFLDQLLHSSGGGRMEHEYAIAATLSHDTDQPGDGICEQHVPRPRSPSHTRGEAGRRRARGTVDRHRVGRGNGHTRHASG
jgi:hypothetical protein